MREPQRLETMGNLAAGLARDLLLWAAWNNSTLAILHLPEFCKMFGYQRQHLLRPLDEKKQKRLKKAVLPEDVERLNFTLGWTVLAMAKYNLIFYTNSEGRIPLTLSKKTRVCRYQSLQILTDFSPETCITKYKTGTVATMHFSERFIYNCREFYQVVDLPEYLSLVTATGKPDDQARRLYLHMTWRRQIWDGIAIPNKNFNPAKPDYYELLSVAGLKFADAKKNAALLRALLKKVCQLPSVSCSWDVTHEPLQNTYKVQLAKLGGRVRPKRPKRAAQQKLAV